LSHEIRERLPRIVLDFVSIIITLIVAYIVLPIAYSISFNVPVIGLSVGLAVAVIFLVILAVLVEIQRRCCMWVRICSRKPFRDWKSIMRT